MKVDLVACTRRVPNPNARMAGTYRPLVAGPESWALGRLAAARSPHASSTRREFIVGGAALAGLVLAGCGSSGSGSGGSDGSGDTSSGTREVEDAFGTTEIPQQPKRVVADSVSTYAHLVSLGITPVGVAFPEGISPDYIGQDSSEIPNVVSDDGWTINIEEALALKPDLIVAVGADYNEEYCEKYKEAAATFCFADYYDTGTDEDMKKTLRGLGVGLGREEEAEKGIAAYEERTEALKARVAKTDLPSKKVGIVRVDAGGFIGIRTGQSSNGVVGALGLTEPEWPKGNEDGYVELSLENLGTLDDADILIVNTDDDVVVEDSDVFASPLWKGLDVVTSGNAHFVGAWNGGDLPQYEQMLTDIDAAIVEPAESGS